MERENIVSDDTQKEEPQLEEEQTDEKDWKAEAEKWKALSRQNEAKAKENFEKAKRLDEIEEASKTELEKLQSRNEELEAIVKAQEEAESLKKLTSEIASEKKFEELGIPVSALRGSTRDELEAHADVLISLIPAKPKGATGDAAGDRGDDIERVEADANEIAANVRL